MLLDFFSDYKDSHAVYNSLCGQGQPLLENNIS